MRGCCMAGRGRDSGSCTGAAQGLRGLIEAASSGARTQRSLCHARLSLLAPHCPRSFNARANNRGWRLDHFLVSEALQPRVHDCYLLPQVLGSDHCPLGLVLRLG